MDIQQELERSIGHGPALPTPDQRLRAGRAALRRRRITVGAGAMAVLVAVAAPFALNGSGATQGSDLPPAAPPTSSVEPSPDRTLRADPERRFDVAMGEVAYVDFATSTLMIHPDAVVVERIDGLYPGKGTQSVALDLKLDGKRYWVELEWDEGGGGGTYGGPQDDFYDDFADFVAKATSGGGMTSGPPPSGQSGGDSMPVPGKVEGLTMTPEGFEAGGDTRIFEQRLDPNLPNDFATDEMRTAAAYVQMAGVRQLVLFRDEIGGGTGQLFAVHSDGHGDALDELIAWARERYESGEGLL